MKGAFICSSSKSVFPVQSGFFCLEQRWLICFRSFLDQDVITALNDELQISQGTIGNLKSSMGKVATGLDREGVSQMQHSRLSGWCILMQYSRLTHSQWLIQYSVSVQ